MCKSAMQRDTGRRFKKLVVEISTGHHCGSRQPKWCGTTSSRAGPRASALQCVGRTVLLTKDQENSQPEGKGMRDVINTMDVVG